MYNEQALIVPRKGPDLGLQGDIPRYWLDGDPFKTRFFDALSAVFPEGEKFFITSVREYRDEITDPQLLQDVKNFTFQEGQHSMVHRQYNEQLRRQGIDIDAIDRRFQGVFSLLRRRFPRWFPLASTSAIEHFTATFSHAYLESGQMAGADPRMRSLFAWHCVEEFEHKDVAFDVLKKVAKVGYFGRIGVMLWITLTFQLHIFVIMKHMFDVDGLPKAGRGRMWIKGLRWLYGPGSMGRTFLPNYFAYLKPGYHPSHLKTPKGYGAWVGTYERSGDPLAAGDAALNLAA